MASTTTATRSPSEPEDVARKVSLSSASTSNTEMDGLVFERRTMRRIDLRMLPLLGLLYSVALIDRTNLGVARIAGMGEDLELSIGTRYSLVSCVYFIPYILLELPSNALLRVCGSRNLLSFSVVAWGAVQLSMGFVPNWRILALCRVLLGAFEVGYSYSAPGYHLIPLGMLFPGTCIHHYNMVQTSRGTKAVYPSTLHRTSSITDNKPPDSLHFISFLSSLAVSARYWPTAWLSWQGRPISTAGLGFLQVIEGALTIVFGGIAWLFLPEFPDNNTFLNKEQTKFVLQRIEEDRGDALPDIVTIWKILRHLADWKIWVYGIMFMCTTIPAYAIGFFVTIILSGMGWDLTHALLLSAPPFVFAASFFASSIALSVFVFAWLSDHFRSRAPFLALQALMTLVGFTITGFVQQPGWRYFGLFIANAGSAGCVPGIIAYASNNVVSHSKRAVTTAVIGSFGGIGGIIATTVFRQQDFPRYIPGIITTISCQVLLLALLGVLTLNFWYQNKAKQDAGRPEMGGHIGLLYTL
ncbi:hypothetical protein D9757_000508 [Collybiopsis confluens]|uniref:MFS general substrate transporter n=1 Tax=Collybiopsis confluens TaxID=2823264 RepID=A0A8H5I231_9AGAR|nr:hypothetical protein D9757_000508 [Collybiopsis confluens]